MNNTKIKLPFALDENNVLVHIADVESGKKYFYICPACRLQLIAVKGQKRVHHFRHATEYECENGLESAIHLAAKQAILKRKQITLPERIIEASARDSRGCIHKEQRSIVRNGEIRGFDSVEEEKPVHDMKVDILGIRENDPLIIEVFYRHKVDEIKREKITKSNVSAIEIDLSELTPEDVKDWDAFWISINDVNRIQWLHHAKVQEEEQKLESQLALKIQSINTNYDQNISIRRKLELEDEKRRMRANDFYSRFNRK